MVIGREIVAFPACLPACLSCHSKWKRKLLMLLRPFFFFFLRKSSLRKAFLLLGKLAQLSNVSKFVVDVKLVQLNETFACLSS